MKEAKERALKVPTPSFLLDRLRANKKAFLLTGSEREELSGQRFLLVNERLKKGEPTWAWGRATFTLGRRVNSVQQLTRDERESVDPVMLREFMVREGPLWLLKMKLITAFPKPRRLKSAPPGRFSSFVDLSKDVVREAVVVEGIRPAFGSPGGKRRLAKEIVSFIPEHNTYVEAFIGGGSVLFMKLPSNREVINDLDGSIASAFKVIQSLDEGKMDRLRSMPLKYSPKIWEKLKTLVPGSDVARLHRFIYMRAFSFGNDPNSGKYSDETLEGRSIENKIEHLPFVTERLKNVQILNEDFRRVIARNNSTDTFFYLDPPYPDQQNKLKTNLTNSDILEVVKSIKGKFILSLPNTPSVRETFSQFDMKSIETRGTFDQGRSQVRKEFLISNFPLQASTRFLKEKTEPSGIHDHPHDEDGSHKHLGLPEGGNHKHDEENFGSHTHREGDPPAGWHLNVVGDDGSHQHIPALIKDIPELEVWMKNVIAVHFPVHKWLEGHKQTWIQHVDKDPEPRIATEQDWMNHFGWMHSSGMHSFRHGAIFLDTDTQLIKKWYEFEDGMKREATSEDFEKEEAWMLENLPFPVDLFQSKHKDEEKPEDYPD